MKITYMMAALLPITFLMTAPASAEFIAEDLAQYHLSECGDKGFRHVREIPGPVTPRIYEPVDVAPWLNNRDWDVRPYADCPEQKVVKKIKKVHQPVKKAKPVRAVPQK